ncbi:doublesex- and mab-3-related transcription factor C1 [Dipodomys spectabilis]|uniref:doublesex- and mab-3-related transcription factor C1 n=1 Tax=Dipodomys spectabilis TaxID=105255 RepID=UPI001C53F7EE|nr:doublesex- and mab-3-related transcription factor C1 [Dipodomys spectabilis]
MHEPDEACAGVQEWEEGRSYRLLQCHGLLQPAVPSVAGRSSERQRPRVPTAWRRPRLHRLCPFPFPPLHSAPLRLATGIRSCGSGGGGLRLQTLGLRVFSAAAAAAPVATSLPSRPRTQGSSRPPNARGRASLPRVPASWASQSRREHRKKISSLSIPRREHREERRRKQGSRSKKIMASQSHMPVKRLAIEASALTGMESTMSQPGTSTCITLQEESSQRPLMLSLPPATSSLPYTPGTLEKEMSVSHSGELYGPPTLPIISSSLIYPSYGSSDSLLMQPQVPNASDQASVSAALEWQQMMEAAEALLALKNSSRAAANSKLCHQPSSPPGSAGDIGLEPSSPCARSNSPNSVSVPIGHLGYISLLN